MPPNSNEAPKQLPGQGGFYLVTNEHIYKKINDMERYFIQLKTVVYILSFIVTPAVSTTVGIIVSNISS